MYCHISFTCTCTACACTYIHLCVECIYTSTITCTPSITYAISQEEDSCTLIDGVHYSQQELPASVDSGEPSLGIVALLSEQSTGLEVLVRHAHHHDRQRGVDQVEDGEVDSINRVGARPGIEQLPPKQQHCICLPYITE